MAEAKDKKTDSKPVEVAKPDKAPATAKTPTVTKHAMMTEPSAEATKSESTPASADDKPVSPDTAPTPASKVRIEPLSKPEDLKSDDDKKAAETAAKDDAPNEDDDGNDLDSRDKIKDVSSDEQDLIDSKAAERQANYDKIVVAKTYFLPINQVVRRRSKRVAIAGTVLAVVLALAWLDIALDAGLITIPGIEAPTHFFSS